MGKTNIEYADEVSNPLQAKDLQTGKKGTHCEKPDPDGTCKNCWAEVLNTRGNADNQRFGTGLTFDRANRDRVTWLQHHGEMARLERLNRRRPMSTKFPGLPLVVFTNDTYDLFQPSISDGLRDWVFDHYDKLTDLTLLIQTTYASRMAKYLTARYPNGMPSQYFIGMSAGTDKFLFDNCGYLLSVKAHRRYLIFEPLLEGIPNADIWFSLRMNERCETAPEADVAGYDIPAISLVIIGGESGTGARQCDVQWIRGLARQAQNAGIAVLVKQLGSKPVDGSRMSFDHDKIPVQIKSRKGGKLEELPADLRIRQMPEVAHA